MAEPTANGTGRGENGGAGRGFDPRKAAARLFGRRRLPYVYALLFLVVSLLLFPPLKKIRDVRFREGDIADVDVIAPFDFIVPHSEQEIESNRAKAVLSVPPVYRENREIVRHLPEDLEAFMTSIRDIAMAESLDAAKRVDTIREMAPALSRDRVELLLDREMRRRILQIGLDLQRSLFERGIVNDASPLRRRDFASITVVDGTDERTMSTASLISQGELESVILDRAGRNFDADGKAIDLFYDIVRSHLMPNLVYDPDETRARREAKMRTVPKYFTVSRNERIVAKHDRVTRTQVSVLEALEERKAELELETSGMKRVLLYIGKALRIASLLAVFLLALRRFSPGLIADPGKTTLVFIIVFVYLLLTALVTRYAILDPYLVPVAFVSLVTAAFFGVMPSVAFTLFSAFLLLTHTDLPGSHAFIAILAGTAAIISIAQLRERRHFYTIFLYIAIAYIIGIAGFGLTERISVSQFLFSSLWGITNSFICTILVMFLLPIFESIFDVTTNFTLMELSDLNRPLLRRLIMEAPGTYHHSLMVGNLVEAVAGEVGANSLLARVAAYYHDIGKLAKPEYFFENKGDNVNKHEKLAPTMSALILGSHVKEGVELARKEKLPRVISDAIREHHGTTVMAYFYQKALEYDSHDSVNVDDFRYPGPRPSSKENALIMLADSCEAAVRSLKEPTAPRIRAIVSRLVQTRMNDGELDDSGLTLNDIAVIREKYIQLLTGIFHPRISYPGQEREERGGAGPRDYPSGKQAQGERKRHV
ncbi:MAG: HDIG domain-containing protein [Candidatus Krumholzibacteriota bacterium]|nr:HDIG domain-containing protein [Candidatus Krumholzibacteriota bacterium]